jgi:hypothetical protein
MGYEGKTSNEPEILRCLARYQTPASAWYQQSVNLGVHALMARFRFPGQAPHHLHPGSFVQVQAKHSLLSSTLHRSSDPRGRPWISASSYSRHRPGRWSGQGSRGPDTSQAALSMTSHNSDTHSGVYSPNRLTSRLPAGDGLS